MHYHYEETHDEINSNLRQGKRQTSKSLSEKIERADDRSASWMSQAEDNTNTDTRKDIMPKDEHALCPQAASEQYKKDQAKQNVERRKQSRAKKKASTERDLLKIRDAQMIQSKAKEATAQNAHAAERQQRHRSKERAAQKHNKKAEADTADKAQGNAQTQAEQEVLRRDSARERKRRS